MVVSRTLPFRAFTRHPMALTVLIASLRCLSFWVRTSSSCKLYGFIKLLLIGHNFVLAVKFSLRLRRTNSSHYENLGEHSRSSRSTLQVLSPNWKKRSLDWNLQSTDWVTTQKLKIYSDRIKQIN